MSYLSGSLGIKDSVTPAGKDPPSLCLFVPLQWLPEMEPIMFEISLLSADKFKVWLGRKLIAIVQKNKSGLDVVWGNLNDIGLGIVSSIIKRERLDPGW